MPIPYMGSKRKSAQMIFNVIVNRNPNLELLVDLFCGGFAISEIFIKNGYSVIANDKNKCVIALIDKTLNEGLPNEVTDFVGREKFYDILNNPDNYEDWYIGYVECCWSFGNNQRNYIYGKDTEAIKLAGHNLIINKDASSLVGIIPQKYIDGILKQTDWHKRRIALLKVSKALQNRNLDLQRLESLERLQSLERLESLQRLESLESLQRLQSLESLESLERLQSKNYNEVYIPENAIIYCDPPYRGTTEYKEGSFNHYEFWEWVRMISQTNKVYVSEYSAPDDFVKLLEFTQKSSLQGGTQTHSNQPNECLFAPIGQEKYNTLISSSSTVDICSIVE